MAVQLFCDKNLAITKTNYPEAYLKVENINIKVDRKKVWFDVIIYANKESRNTAGAVTIFKKIFMVDLDKIQLTTLPNLHSDVYAYVKKMPEFQGIDV